MKKKILLIDDDAIPMAPYKTALEKSDFIVTAIADVDKALEIARDSLERFDIVLLDVMMPPGNAFDLGETDDGMRTGVFLYGELRKHYHEAWIIVLTNMRDGVTLDMFPTKEDRQLRVVLKYKYPPFEIVELIKGLLK